MRMATMVVVLVVVGPELTTHNSTHTHSLTLTAADGRAIVVVLVVAVVLVPREQQHSQADNTETGQKQDRKEQSAATVAAVANDDDEEERRGEERRDDGGHGGEETLARSLALSLPPAFLSLPFPLPLYGSSLCSLRSSSSSFPWALEVVVVWLAGSLQQKCEGTE